VRAIPAEGLKIFMSGTVASTFSMSVIMIFLAGAGIVTPIAGALLHNLGAFVILINSGRIMRHGI